MLSQETSVKLRALVDEACGVGASKSDTTNQSDNDILQPLNFASVVIISKDSNSETPKEVFKYAAGKPKLLLENGGTPTTTTDSTYLLHWIASLTKLVTGIACMQLVERGQLSLDDADQVETLCPELKDVMYLADDGTLKPKTGRITLRMLLTHTAGFGYNFTSQKLQNWMMNRDPQVPPTQLEFWQQPLVNQPGSKFEYGISLDWAGFVVERVTGMGLDEYMRHNIFEPLGIKDMTMFPDNEDLSRLLAIEQRLPDGKLVPRDHPWQHAIHVPEHEKSTAVRSGGAGLFGTPKEYSKILAMLLNDGVSTDTGKRILSTETVVEMFRNQLADTPNFARQHIPAVVEELVRPADGFYSLAPPSAPQGWGLSFMISPSVTGRSDSTAHWAGISNLFWWCDREKGVAGVVASQILPFPDPKAGELWAHVETVVYEKPGKL